MGKKHFSEEQIAFVLRLAETVQWWRSSCTK